MGFTQLFRTEDITTADSPATSSPQRRRTAGKPGVKKKKKTLERGCSVCPLNTVPGVKKIMGTVDPAKEILVVAQSPGPEENAQGIELIGRSGKFFWSELKKVGISRDDCSIQNVVRCFPADVDEVGWLKMRTPTAEEIRCCSIHTEQQLSKSKARHILVLGQLAAKALLQTRSLPQQKVFYSETFRAKIYLVDHPAYFVRAGLTSASDSSSHDKLKQLRTTLALLSRNLADGANGAELSDPFSYVRKQKYHVVDTPKKAIQASTVLRRYARAGHRLSVDVENFVDGGGNTVVTCCGFSPKPGLAFVFLFTPALARKPQRVFVIVSALLGDESIRKAFHWGPSDYFKLREMGAPVAGYDFDTLFSEYFAHPDQKKYGLEEIVSLRLPEFSGYKALPYSDFLRGAEDVPEHVLVADTAVQARYIKQHKLFDMRKVGKETYRLYNGADADVTKRVELLNRGAAPQALMQLYVDLGLVLYRMESNGPLFDHEHNAKLALLYPRREAKLLSRLREIIGDENYNPASPQQVANALWVKLGLTYPGHGKPDTRKETLMQLDHEFPQLQLQVRKVQKALGTYIEGFKRCASLNDGRLRTHWKAWGTATGRLSSGGEKGDPGCVNLQNIPKDPQIKNMLVADVRWRKVYLAFGKIYPELASRRKKCAEAMLQWVIQHMPNLRTYLGFDFGQVEVRVAALISGDKNLIADCAAGDIHSLVGAAMTGWSVEKIKKEKRTRTLTKNVHFGILYGQSEDGTVNYVRVVSSPEDRAKITDEEIRRAYRNYFKRYYGVKAWVERQRNFVREHGYCETLFGLRRPLDIREDRHGEDEFVGDDTESGRSSYWGNMALNSPIQGSAHQVMACALANLHRKPKKYRILGTPVLEVHDYLGFTVPVLQLVEAYCRAKDLLEKESLRTVASDFPHINWTVPLVVEGEGGLRLGDQVELQDDFTVGEFLLNWYESCKKHEEALDAELLSSTN